MSLNNNALANELVNKTLWWRYSSFEEKGALLLSSPLKRLFSSAITQLEDMTGCYTTPIIQIKIQEILANPEADVRFIASYDTRHGKSSFQHQLNVYTESGQRYVLAHCMDVTEMVALEREIVDAQGRLSLTQLVERQTFLEAQNRIIKESYQKQSRFLAMLSHELRSPLLGISSLVQRLRVKQTDEKVLTALKAIHITAEQSTFLVNDILTYSQTEYDEITLHPMTFSLKEILQNVKQLTRSIAADKGLMVSLIYLGDRDQVVGDSVRLSQVLINLIVNSIKFTQYGGVTIEVAQKEKNRFSFKVTDSGEGIANDQLERIFEPYAQLESMGSTQNIGSGLGLLVVKKLVALMGGEISVTSTLGVGTSFNFDLFLDENQKSIKDVSVEQKMILESTTLEEASIKNSIEHVKPSKNNHSEVLNTFHVLIADDSKINLMVLGGYLQELNCLVVEAKNGREAWDLFLENTFDYVFLDIQMPFLDGIEVSQKIKECVDTGCSAAKNLKKVFAVTAGGDESNFTLEGEPVDSNGFDHWFVKPVSKAQIINVLQTSSGVSNAKPQNTKIKNTKTQKRVKKQSEKSSSQATRQSKNVNKASRVKNSVSDIASEPWEGIDDVPKQFQGLIDDFLLDLNNGIMDLKRMIQEKDAQGLSKKAHYLKGNCMLLQLNGMVTTLRKIEKTVQENQYLVDNIEDKLTFIVEKLQFGLKSLEKSITIRHNAV